MAVRRRDEHSTTVPASRYLVSACRTAARSFCCRASHSVAQVSRTACWRLLYSVCEARECAVNTGSLAVLMCSVNPPPANPPRHIRRRAETGVCGITLWHLATDIYTHSLRPTAAVFWAAWIPPRTTSRRTASTWRRGRGSSSCRGRATCQPRGPISRRGP